MAASAANVANGLKVAVIYYSATGNVHALAEAVAEGAEKAGAEVRLRRVPELAPAEAIDSNPAWRAHADATADLPVATHDDLRWADAYAFGTPTRFGNVAAQLKQFLDTTASLWKAGDLSDKAVTAFTSAINTHGGNESTLLALYNTMYHWGAIIVPTGYTDPAISPAGGNPTAPRIPPARERQPTPCWPPPATRAAGSCGSAPPSVRRLDTDLGPDLLDPSLKEPLMVVLTALIVVDMQNAFIAPSNGPPVDGASDVVGAVNSWVADVAERGWPIFYTQDVAPTDLPPGDPDHQLDLHAEVDVRGPVVPKGPGKNGGFSAFVLDSVAGPGTGGLSPLAGLLRDAGVDTVVVVGLAADVCVSATARDARRLGYAVTVPLGATAFVHAHPDGDAAALADLRDAGVVIIDKSAEPTC
ncbi:NAD(P)H:quinone oxidoreductase [Flindersiella endophytica]